MANYISKITLPDGKTYSIKDNNGYLYGFCSTAAATATKVVTVSSDPDFELFEGMMIHVFFDQPNTVASPSLNVNGTGAVPILVLGGTDMGLWKAGDLITFTYDSNAKKWYRHLNTLMTAGSADTSNKIYLVGAEAQSTYNNTYSQDTTFIDTDESLHSTSYTVKEKVNLQWNETDESLDFIFL